MLSTHSVKKKLACASDPKSLCLVQECKCNLNIIGLFVQNQHVFESEAYHKGQSLELNAVEPLLTDPPKCEQRTARKALFDFSMCLVHF